MPYFSFMSIKSSRVRCSSTSDKVTSSNAN